MGIIKGVSIAVGIVSGLVLALAVVGLLQKGTGDGGLGAFLLLVAVGGFGVIAAVLMDRLGSP